MSEQVEGMKKDMMDFTEQKLERMAEAIVNVVKGEKKDIEF